MEFNPSKRLVIRVMASRTPLQTQYILHRQVLEAVSSARYLGVDISSNLSWNTHVNRITSNANRSLGFIKRNIKTKSPQIREAAYSPWSDPSQNMLHQHGTPIPNRAFSDLFGKFLVPIKLGKICVILGKNMTILGKKCNF